MTWPFSYKYAIVDVGFFNHISSNLLLTPSVVSFLWIFYSIHLYYSMVIKTGVIVKSKDKYFTINVNIFIVMKQTHNYLVVYSFFHLNFTIYILCGKFSF